MVIGNERALAEKVRDRMSQVSINFLVFYEYDL